MDCVTKDFNSRVCEEGTKGCVIRHGNSSALSDGLVVELGDVKRLLDCDTLIAACSCYAYKTNGSMSAFLALDKVRLRVEKIIDKINN